MKLSSVYIYLAVGCGMVGMLITFIVLFICFYLGVDIAKNMWIIAIPILLAIILNISLIELVTRRRR
jgi:hypothetical protein